MNKLFHGDSLDTLRRFIRDESVDQIQIVTAQQILGGVRMNLPLMEEVSKKASKRDSTKQDGLFSTEEEVADD